MSFSASLLFLDLLLAAAFLSTLFGMATLRMPSGPEGPVGAWLLLVFPCLFLGALLVLMIARGLVASPGIGVQIPVAIGLWAAILTCFIFSMDRSDSALSSAARVLPFTILLGCLVVLHGPSFSYPDVVARVVKTGLGAAALVGWAAIGTGIFLYVKSDLEASAAKASREDAMERDFETTEVNEYRNLPGDAPLHVVMRYTWSRNAKVKQESRVRVEQWPGLDDAIIQLLNEGNETVITYVSLVYATPPAKLAPAWGSMLERQLQAWDVLQYDQYAGKWEPNLSSYFEGAHKIQKSGGNLKPQLEAWYAFLKKCKGMGNLAAFVKTLI